MKPQLKMQEDIELYRRKRFQRKRVKARRELFGETWKMGQQRKLRADDFSPYHPKQRKIGYMVSSMTTNRKRNRRTSTTACSTQMTKTKVNEKDDFTFSGCGYKGNPLHRISDEISDEIQRIEESPLELDHEWRILVDKETENLQSSVAMGSRNSHLLKWQGSDEFQTTVSNQSAAVGVDKGGIPVLSLDLLIK